MTPKKKKTAIIIITIVAALVIIYIIAVLTGNTKQPISESSSNTSSTTTEESEGGLIKKTEIIWKDEEGYGIVNFYLDGTNTKESILSNYYTEIKDYITSMDTSKLEDYEYIEFVGNVVRDDKIECTIRGNLSSGYITSNQVISTVDLEKNITDLFIPEPLK